jgi:hypothetical protein
VAVVGRSLVAATNPVILGDRVLSADGIELNAVYTVPVVAATTTTPIAYLVPATRAYVDGYPPVVLKVRVYTVLAELKIVVSEAVLATKVALPEPSTVYKPKRTRLCPVVCVEAEATDRELTVASQRGVKKVKYVVELDGVPLKFPLRGYTSTTEVVSFVAPATVAAVK